MTELQDAKPLETSHGHSLATISDLPVEILIDIFRHLSPVDLRDIRMVCKKWFFAVSDKRTWIAAFHSRFKTGQSFASVTGSERWLTEYFGRIALTKQWAKAKGKAHLYQLINSEYGVVNFTMADFKHDRLMTFCKALGSISMCSLTLGKNQVFIPENHLFTLICAYHANWSYLCVGRTSGEVYVKNLMTATASGSNKMSITEFKNTELPIMGIRINTVTDRHKEKCDMVYLDAQGTVFFCSLGGRLLYAVALDDSALFLDTDFENYVVIVSVACVHWVDFHTGKLVLSFKHGWIFTESPRACHVDFGDTNIVICHDEVKVFHMTLSAASEEPVSFARAPKDTQIIGGTMQNVERKRSSQIAGGDGLLYALTLSDGSVCIFNVRSSLGRIQFNTRIHPFKDLRSPVGIEPYTKVAINSSVVAIGALADWVHIYDAHSGAYLREGIKVSRKLTRQGMAPILEMKFAPDGAAGVVVSGDVVQYFHFGDNLVVPRKPKGPQATDTSSRREISQHIRLQIDDYDLHQHMLQERETMADKYNGTGFDTEQEELRMAMALSASYSETTTTPEDELEEILRISELANIEREGAEDEVLRRVLELLMVDH